MLSYLYGNLVDVKFSLTYEGVWAVWVLADCLEMEKLMSVCEQYVDDLPYGWLTWLNIDGMLAQQQSYFPSTSMLNRGGGTTSNKEKSSKSAVVGEQLRSACVRFLTEAKRDVGLRRLRLAEKYGLQEFLPCPMLNNEDLGVSGRICEDPMLKELSPEVQIRALSSALRYAKPQLQGHHTEYENDAAKWW